MGSAASHSQDTGLEVIDLENDPTFSTRSLRARPAGLQLEGMVRLAQAFVNRPSAILQELANAAVELCGADSSGISLENPHGDESNYYQWVATAGEYSGFLNASLPRFPSACGICLERGSPQLFRVTQRFFDIMGVQAPTVTDGILLPWQADGVRGTIWIMAHGRSEAFDRDDARMMQLLANFAALGVREQQQQKLLMQQTQTAAAAAMANELAHRINNPLQSLTNMVYLAAESNGTVDAKSLARELGPEIQRLASLVHELLSIQAIPIRIK
jgi:hypothetical protein